MLDLECKICYNLFDRSEHLPRIVNCGHTFCSECLIDLLQASKTCPSCKKIIANDNGVTCDSFIVNYFVLEMKDSEGQSLSSREDFVETSFKRLLKLKADYFKLKTAVNVGKERFDRNLTMIDDIEKSINEMCENHNPFDQDYHGEVKKFKKSYEDLRREIIPSDVNRTGDATMLSGSYDTNSSYLTEIYKGILSEKKFAAVTKIDDVTNYAKLSVRDNFLFIHAFEKTKMEKGDVVTVCFSDFVDKLLKKRVYVEATSTSDAKAITAPRMSAEVYGFLDLTYGTDGFYRRVFVDVLSTASHLGCQFLKYCSGEEGYSYKGFKYEQKLGDSGADFSELKNDNVTVDRLIQLQNWNRNDASSNRLNVSRYLQNKNDTLVACDFDTYYLRFEDDGSFEILKFQFTQKTHSIRPNKEATFGSTGWFSKQTSLPTFDFKSAINNLDSTSTLGAQNTSAISNLLSTSDSNSSIKHDSAAPFGSPNSSTKSDSIPTFGLPNSSTKSDSIPTFNLPNSSTKSDSIPTFGLPDSSTKLDKRPCFNRKKFDKHPNPLAMFGVQDSSTSKDSTIDSGTTCDLQSSRINANLLRPSEFQHNFPLSTACNKSSPKVSKIVGSVLDHEMNIQETFAEAMVRIILDCGIAFKL